MNGATTHNTQDDLRAWVTVVLAMPIPLEVVTMVTVFLRDRTTLFSVGDFERTLAEKEGVSYG